MTAAKKKYKYIYITTVILGLISAFFMSRFSLCLGNVIDVVLAPTQALINTVLICVIMLICWLATSCIYDYTEIIYANKVTRYIKQQLYKALYNKEINEFNNEKAGAYLSLYSKDMDILVDNYLIPKCDIVNNVLNAIICLASIFIINWKLGISFVLISAFTIVFSQIPGIVMANKTKEYTQANKSYLSLLENYLNGFEQVKLLCIENLFRKKLNQKDSEYENTRKNYLLAKKLANDVGMSFGMLSQVLCMSVGIWFVLHDDMTVGMLISAVQLLNGVFSPIQNFVSDKNLMGTATEIIERLETNSQINTDNGIAFNEKINLINFKDIRINFGENKIFDGYNLELEKGKKYVIIGESGRGKSTLMKLLMKYIPRQYYDGTVTVNGYDIRNIDSQFLYKKIGYIQKNEFLIEGTVTDNILLHRENVSCEAVSSICENLKLDKNFANKQITFSNNQQVSYGEKQRIDIARFLINDYDVLIFDEPTSNLDEKTSDVIFDTIMSIQDKIVIVITHDIRDEIIKKFDDIIRL